LTIALTSCAATRKWQQALQLFTTMERFNLKADVITYNATISAMEKLWQIWVAFKRAKKSAKRCIKKKTHAKKSTP